MSFYKFAKQFVIRFCSFDAKEFQVFIKQFVIHFFTSQIETKLTSRKTIVCIRNISASANINPLPYLPLSRKELSVKNAQPSEIIKENIPEIFRINENVFFKLLVVKLQSKITQGNLFPQ